MRPFKETNYGIYERTFIHENKVITHRVGDVSSVLERNKKAYNSAPEFGKYKNFQTKIAEIPVIILDKWAEEDKVNILAMGPKAMDEYLKKKLADPANRFLKTMPGRSW